MRKIREVLRLKYGCGQSYDAIAISCGIGKTSVCNYVSRAAACGLGWPLPPELGDDGLERLLFPPVPNSSIARSEPDWDWIRRELAKKNVTKQLIWQEYKAGTPTGYQYSQFCNLYRDWLKTVSVIFRHEHRAGEKLFVDYAGHTISIHDPRQGGVRDAQIFVAVLGASNFTYSEATWTQGLADWTGSHVRAFEYFGGTTEILVPDNLKAGVSRVCRYDPDINPTYYAMARHYQCAVMPARPYKPRDKAKAEVGVQIVERWILAALRNRTFFSLEELNQAISVLLERLNTRPFRKLKGNRRSLFEELDRPALRPLPAVPFQIVEFKLAKVNIDYHVELLNHYYSVPSSLVQKAVEVRYTDKTVEVFFANHRVASHLRSLRPWAYTTVKEHMPRSHQEYVKWTPERLLRWVSEAGPGASRVAERIIASKPHPQQGFKAVLGLLRLGEVHGNDSLDGACLRALEIGAPTYKTVKSMLQSGLYKKPLETRAPEAPAIDHPNIRGPQYYSTLQ